MRNFAVDEFVHTIVTLMDWQTAAVDSVSDLVGLEPR